MFIRYTLTDGSSKNATVLSQQPKRNSKWSNWLNVSVEGSSKASSLNWDDVETWEILSEPEVAVFLTEIEEKSQDVIDAKEKEINNLIENDVFETVTDEGQSRISCKWVYTSKEGKVKARLVARGFEESVHNARTDSPTCSRQSLRLCFVTCATMKWAINSLDVTSAFLQGNGIEREVFLQPPTEAEQTGMLWKLRRCIYGLKDAPRAWYKRVEQVLLELGGVLSKYDDALFLWHEENKLIGILVSHVDDFIYGGTDSWHEKVIQTIVKNFKISSMCAGTFKYVGLNV